MKSLCVVGTIALMCSSLLVADETKIKDDVPVSSETLHLSELLLHIQNTTQQLVVADDEIRQEAYHELKEGLMIVYALNCLHPEEGYTIQDALGKCYQVIATAADTASNNDILLQSLSLFTSRDDYEQRMLDAQSLQEWTENALTSKAVRSALETTDADIVYFQNDDSVRVGERQPMLYRAGHLGGLSPKILFIKSEKHQRNNSFEILPIRSNRDKNDDRGGASCEGGITGKWGDGKGIQWEGYIKAEAYDSKGNYAEGQITQKDDGTGTIDLRGGHESNNNQ